MKSIFWFFSYRFHRKTKLQTMFRFTSHFGEGILFLSYFLFVNLSIFYNNFAKVKNKNIDFEMFKKPLKLVFESSFEYFDTIEFQVSEDLLLCLEFFVLPRFNWRRASNFEMGDISAISCHISSVCWSDGFSANISGFWCTIPAIRSMLWCTNQSITKPKQFLRSLDILVL